MKVYVLCKQSVSVSGGIVSATASRDAAQAWVLTKVGNFFVPLSELADFSPAAYLSKRGASKGGKARQAAMTPAERSAHGSKMIAARWGKRKGKSNGTV